jgi:hypothetical protein
LRCPVRRGFPIIPQRGAASMVLPNGAGVAGRGGARGRCGKSKGQKVRASPGRWECPRNNEHRGWRPPEENGGPWEVTVLIEQWSGKPRVQFFCIRRTFQLQ